MHDFRKDFCDYYLWFEVTIKERMENLENFNKELKSIKDLIVPDLTSKRNDYIFVVLRVNTLNFFVFYVKYIGFQSFL